MLKRNWNWRNNRLFCHIFVIGENSIGGGPPGSPILGYAYAPIKENKKGIRKFSARILVFSNTISTVQKIVLSSSRGQGNFRGLEASRPRTSKCVLEDSTSAVYSKSKKLKTFWGKYYYYKIIFLNMVSVSNAICKRSNVNFYYLFRFVYFVMEFCVGGELFSLLTHANSFDDNMARFYAGCVVEALAFLHSKHIIFRDLKVGRHNVCFFHDSCGH